MRLDAIADDKEKRMFLKYFQAYCKVIRVDTRTTNYKQSPTTVKHR